MKLRNLFFTTLTVGLFAACSTEEVPTPITGGEEAMVNISMMVTDGSIVSKADGTNAIEKEAHINRLTMIVMDATSIVAKKDTFATTTASLDFIGNLAAPAGVYDVLIVANAELNKEETSTNIKALTTRQAVLDYTQVLSTQSSNEMLMASKFYKGVNFTGVIDGARITYFYMHDGTETKPTASATRDDAAAYISGAPVKLYRQAARIEMVELKYTGDLNGATFKLDSIYLVNVRANTYVTEHGVRPYTFEVVPPATEKQWISGLGEFDVIDHIISESFTPTPGLGEPYEGVEIDSDGITFNAIVGTSYPFRKYVFESNPTKESVTPVGDEEVGHTEAFQTTLVIVGTFSGSNGTYPDGKRYYHIPIHNGKDTKVYGVKHNTIYKVSATITGAGSKFPDGGKDALANINAKVVVVDWDVVEIIEDVN